LRTEEVDKLLSQYRAGSAIKDLAAHFDIDRDTVSSILSRRQL
jgi:uncharacterized protein (DUF433 family)